MGLTPVYELGKPWPVGWADGLSSSGSCNLSSSTGSPRGYVKKVKYLRCRYCDSLTRDLERTQCTQCGASLIDQIE